MGDGRERKGGRGGGKLHEISSISDDALRSNLPPISPTSRGSAISSSLSDSKTLLSKG